MSLHRPGRALVRPVDGIARSTTADSAPKLVAAEVATLLATRALMPIHLAQGRATPFTQRSVVQKAPRAQSCNTNPARALDDEARGNAEQRRPPGDWLVRNVADALVQHLSHVEIDTYFGVPGGAIEPLFDALARQQRLGRARLVLMRSELAAAFAADGYFRETGQLAVCTATTGPGISNLLTGVLSAHADRVPMLVITPHVAASKVGRGGLQDSSTGGHDLTRVLSEGTRASATVTCPSQLPHTMRRLLYAAHNAPRGPVHLALSAETLRGALDTPWPAASNHTIRPPRAVDIAALAELSQLVGRARRPVFYVGDDAGEATTAVCDLARQLGTYVVSSPAGKRWLNHEHPAYVGVVGFSGHPEAYECIGRSDLIVAFGATFDELSTDGWSALPQVPIYSIDQHLEHAHRLEQIRPVLADSASAARALSHPSWGGSLVQYQSSFGFEATEAATAAEQESDDEDDAEPVSQVFRTNRCVHPKDLMTSLGQLLPPHVCLHVDAGNGFSWSTHYLRRKLPNTYRVAMGLSSMGWSIGAAVGAALGSKRRTVAVCGDGSLLMSSWELTVAVAEQLPVTYVVLNDSGLGMVRHGQRLGGAEQVACELPTIRFDQVARACGAQGALITTLNELHDVAPMAFSEDTCEPWVLDVRIDPDVVPPIRQRVAGLANS